MNRRFFFKAAAALCAAPLLPAAVEAKCDHKSPDCKCYKVIELNRPNPVPWPNRKVLIGVEDGRMSFWDPQTGEHWSEQSTDVHSFSSLAEGTQRAVANNYRLFRRMVPLSSAR